MPNLVNAATLGLLWTALNEAPRKPRSPEAAARLLTRIARDGWACRADVEDVFYDTDVRLDRRDLDFEELTRGLDLPWRMVFPRPKAAQKEVWGSKVLAAADLAHLLIALERLGFAVDPMPLVEALLPGIKQKERLANSELSVLWFKKNRHKMDHLTLQIDERAAGCRHIERLTTGTGYRLEFWQDADRAPLALIAQKPKSGHRPLKVAFTTRSIESW